nr:uncharacterized protein LOC109177283 [Ipomoea batatas]
MMDDLFPEIRREAVECDRAYAFQTKSNSGNSKVISKIQHQGDPIVKILVEEWENLAKIERIFTFVGRFAKARPPLDIIRTKLRLVLHVEGEVQRALDSDKKSGDGGGGSTLVRTVVAGISLAKTCQVRWYGSSYLICHFTFLIFK